MYSELNPNDIFSAQNLEDKNMEKVENIINEYKEKSKKTAVSSMDNSIYNIVMSFYRR